MEDKVEDKLEDKVEDKVEDKLESQVDKSEELKEFRDGIFALRTRRFGTVAEIMIKYLYNMSESHDSAFDKYSQTEGRVEVFT